MWEEEASGGGGECAAGCARGVEAANVSKIIREEELKAPEAVFVSPLQRALQTAARMLLGSITPGNPPQEAGFLPHFP